MRFKELFENDDIQIGKSLVGEHGTRYQTKDGYIDVKHSDMQFSPRKQSVVDFVVDDGARGKGLGKRLLKHVMGIYDDLGAQASSTASLKVFYDLGFRNPNIPEGSFADHERIRQEDSSIFVARNDSEGNPY